MREFAEQEIVLPPGGPYQDQRFRVDRQPVAGVLLDEFDRLDDHGRPRWRRRTVTGPAQDGKTLIGLVVAMMFHLFEVKEDVILGAPTMEMAQDKWRRDFLPIIKKTRYASLLPAKGAGSRGGEAESILFGNGAELKFMSAGGGDEKRSGYTARVIGITEADKMDVAGEASREADPVKQIEARTGAWDDRAVIYIECTVSIEEGRIWQEITNGSNSRITMPCRHCSRHVVLEREHLVGWQDAENEMVVEQQAHYCCPECGSEWSEEDRAWSNRRGRIIHKDQQITPGGEVVGPDPPTRTLGFRWNAANSLIKSAARVALEEWKAQHDESSDSGEKVLCQYWWAIPYRNNLEENLRLTTRQIQSRTRPHLPKGLVPEDAVSVAVGIDLNKYRLNWTCLSIDGNKRPHVVEYAAHASDADQLGTDKALQIALREIYDYLEQGFATEDGCTYIPDQVWIDSRWKFKEVVVPFLRSIQNDRYMAAMGFGAGQMRRQKGERNVYTPPKKKNSEVREIGRGYHRVKMRNPRIEVMHVDVNPWKTAVHEGLAIPLRDETGKIIDPPPDRSFTLHAVERLNEHLGYAKQILAEKYEIKFVEGVGPTGVWEQISNENHQLDSTMLAYAAASRYLATGAKQPVVTDFFARQRTKR